MGAALKMLLKRSYGGCKMRGILQKCLIATLTLVVSTSVIITYAAEFSYGTYVSQIDGTEYTFYENGNVDVNGTAGVYSVNEDQITIVAGGYANKYTFEYLGTMLLLYDANGIGIAFDSEGKDKLIDFDSQGQQIAAEKKLDLNEISNSVMMLYCYSGNNLESQGSGFIAFDSDTLVTNYHVIEGTDDVIAIAEDGSEYEVTSIRNYDIERDIAILTIQDGTKREPLTLGDSDRTKKGEEIYTIGSPEGLINSVSSGLLSGTMLIDDKEYIQISAPISEGSSGGICVNAEGDVIGITSAGINEAQNLNFIIPVNDVKTLYEEAAINMNLKECAEIECKELYYQLASEYVGLGGFYTSYEYYKEKNALICIEGIIGSLCLEGVYFVKPYHSMRYIYHDSDMEPLKKGDSVRLYGKVVDGPLENFIYFEVYYVIYT